MHQLNLRLHAVPLDCRRSKVGCVVALPAVPVAPSRSKEKHTSLSTHLIVRHVVQVSPPHIKCDADDACFRFYLARRTP